MFAAFPKVQAASGVVLEAKRAAWCDSALVEIVIASKARQSRLSAAPARLLRCARNDGGPIKNRRFASSDPQLGSWAAIVIGGFWPLAAHAGFGSFVPGP
jgi:hypothetical protein